MSVQWKPFAEVLGEVLAKSAKKHDLILPAKEFVGGLQRMGDTWGVKTEKDETLHLTRNALLQLVKERLGGIPALFNDKSLSERTLQSYLMDRVMAGQENKPLTLRITGSQIDGVLSDAYAFFDNQRLMLLLAGFIREGFLPEKLFAHQHSVSAGARELYLRLIAPDHWDFRNGEQYYGSLAFSNNETGLGSLTVSPALARVACWNYTVAQSTVQASHRFANVDELDREIEKGVKHIHEYSKVMFERTQHTHDVEFTHPQSVFTQVGNALKLSDSVRNKAQAYWVKEGEDRSLWGIVQAFTAGTQELTPSGGKKVPHWDERNHIEQKIWMWSENIMDRHQTGDDVNMLFSSAELIQKSKVLEILKADKQWQPAKELVETLEPAGWIN